MRWQPWRTYYRPSEHPPGYTISLTGPASAPVYLAWAPRGNSRQPVPIGGPCETEDQAAQLCEQHAAQAAQSSADSQP